MKRTGTLSLAHFGLLALLLALLVAPQFLRAADWPRFRGPNGTGVSTDAAVPTTWGDDQNLKWKTELPGPGLSSPIVVGDKVFVTCYTGYGTDPENPGEQANLKRHLICLNKGTGEILWDRSVAATLPEDPYRSNIQEHGYASHTPVSDGERVYAFFGKTGVVAFDMQGNQLWDTSVGTESGQMGWGTASSPILYKDLVIVPATAESEALVALNKQTGSEVWRKEAQGFGGTWGTPVLVEGEGRDELVIAVASEVWSFKPQDGSLLWYAEAIDSNYVTSSAVAAEGVVYLVSGRPAAGVAIRVGGEGDVSKSHLVWSETVPGGTPTPVLFDGHLFAFSGDRAVCVSAKTGETEGQGRLRSSDGRAATAPPDRSGGQGGFGGGRGGGGGQSYASPIVVDGRIYLPTRDGTVFVIEANPKMKVVAQNRFASDDSEFQATPAVSDGQLFLRSNKALYCVAEQ